jgi:hypothetical protein
MSTITLCHLLFFVSRDLVDQAFCQTQKRLVGVYFTGRTALTAPESVNETCTGLSGVLAR